MTSVVLTNLVRSIAGRPAADVLFWSGAGISVPGPTSLPTGWELTERVFRSFFEPDALARILGHHTHAEWLSSPLCDRRTMRSARLPRLETVLGVAFRQFGTPAHAVLDDIRTAPPNRNHDFLAAHLQAGGVQVTANFDTCIEEAHIAEYGKPPVTGAVEHFHRSLDASTTPSELGATLERIQSGFTEDYADQIVERVANAPVSVFVGYSGSDFFDIDVAFATLGRDRLAGCEVHWISHSEHGDFHTVTPTGSDEPQLGRLLARAGATVRYHCGPTGAFLSYLGDAWGFDLEPMSASRRQLRDITVNVDGRRAATLALYRELGLPGEIERLLDSGDLAGVPPEVLWQARSESLWEQGQWNTLRRMWAHGDRPPGIPDAMRQERIGACLWVQGRFVPAYLWLGWHRRRAERAGRDADAWTLAETQARVIEHMARTPELRLVARLLARGAVRRLGKPDQRDGVHRFRRHSDLDTSLRATASGIPRQADHAATSERWFAEAGSMIGALGYAHRALRDSFNSGQPRDEVRRRYRQHFRWAAGVGSRAGAWRMILLPDAHRVFTFAEVIAGVSALQYGHWQRVRILTRSLAKRGWAALGAWARHPGW